MPPDARSHIAPLLFWSEHTAGMAFETGIQRVVRHLRLGLREGGIDVVEAGWDRATRRMRPEPSDTRLAADGGAGWLLVPEIPMTVLAAGLDPVQIGRVYGLRTAAIVHDLIPLKRPTDYTADEARLYERYFQMFAGADLVLATTRLVAEDLRTHLETTAERVPPIVVCALPAQFAHTPRQRDPPALDRDGALRLLSVSTWQPRKNIPGLLRALDRSAKRIGGGRFMLTIVGRRNGWPELDVEIEGLSATIQGKRLFNHATDADVLAFYGDHHASIYPSREEGFGLPVLDSLWLGRPCLCHAGSSMAEVAPGGGTLMIDMADEAAIADTLCRAAEAPDLLPRLQGEAVTRRLGTWLDYADTVASHLGLSRIETAA